VGGPAVAGGLPTGTITFVFTDIEGSTRLGQRLGPDRYGEVLERQRTALRAVWAAHGGVEVGTEGDSFFVAFPSAAEAVAAVADGQRALAATDWPHDEPVRVRMGAHTGEGRLAAGTYVGHDVNRAARVAAAGHGGQVLLSETTRALVADAPPPGTAIRSLGEHRLKDLRPETIFQLDVEGLPVEFPPLRSLDARPNNLPTLLTSFVGREHELVETERYLETTRLLTLTGPGGTGKTRLSLQVAARVGDRFPDGTWFVALEPIRDPALVAPTIARAMGLADSGARPAVDVVADAVGEQRVLLVLDNFEQVLDAAPVVAALLGRCPSLRVVATSRAALHVAGEQEYPVPGLPAPPDASHLSPLERENLPADVLRPGPAALSQYEAVRLFIARAGAVRPGFAVTNENAPAVAAICARLHGMPLAIELAAARVKLLGPDQILARLEQQLGTPSGAARDVPDRQRTLRGAIAWSYDLLDEPVRRLLDRLSVFSGGWDLDAAEAVCGPGPELDVEVIDGLAVLVDQSLVRADTEATDPRFDLFPTIREFAAEMLAGRGEAAVIAAAHTAHFLAVAETAAPHLSGADQRRWLDALERDHDNLRAALERATAAPDPESAVRIAFALWRFWQQRGYLNEARARLATLAAQDWALAPELRARLAEAAGGVAYWQADHAETIRWYDEALAIRRELGDPRELANAMYNRAYAAILPVTDEAERRRNFEASRAMAEEALAIYRELGDEAGEGNLLWALGSLAYFDNDPAGAERWYREALETFRAAGHRTMEAWALHMVATTDLKLGRVDDALAAGRHALRHFRDAGDLSGLTLVLDDLSATAVAMGDHDRAGRLRGAARRLQATTGTELAGWVDAYFEEETRPSAARTLSAADLERTMAAGAAMSLDDAVAYALGERDALP
jgi:predicted ATPase/class 3 adenylate cyclase